MLDKLKRRRLLGFAVAASLALSAGIATVAYASIPDGSGVIHACYHVNGAGQVDGSATLRVIDAASTNKDGTACKKDENALDWNQQAIQGQQGPQARRARKGHRGPQGREWRATSTSRTRTRTRCWRTTTRRSSGSAGSPPATT